jgi:hypothetical protein
MVAHGVDPVLEILVFADGGKAFSMICLTLHKPPGRGKEKI